MYRELKLFACRAASELASEVAERLALPLGGVDVFKFPNDNTFVRITENVRETDVFVFQTSCPPVDENLLELLIMLDTVKRASAARVTAVMSYFPYVRSDKKDQPRVPITARLVADLLVTAGADRIITMDLTADQIQGFFSVPSDHLTAVPILANYYRERIDCSNLVVLAPDPGAVKRARKCAQRLGAPLVFLDKRRLDDSGAVEVTTIVGSVAGKDVLFFDDEIDSAGTLTLAVNEVIRAGASRCFAAASHGVFSPPAFERIRSSPLVEVTVTNSVPVGQAPPAVKILSVAGLFAEAIRRTHNGESITSLFL
ncbi:MAG: ribose-phosphate pyrophosphokinase [Bacillota bacterium]